MKENIIIVGDYNRDDFLYVAKVIADHYNICFLEYAHKSEVKSGNYKKYGTAIFWSDYKSAFDLLNKIKPRKVLFYFIETFNHVALNVACKYAGIATYHMEHGIRNYELLKANIAAITVRQKPEKQFRFTWVKTIVSRLKSRLFFTNTVKGLPEPHHGFLKKYFEVRRANTIFDTFRLIQDPLRVAGCYISFSPRIFEFHQQSDHLPAHFPVRFIGVPSFDYLASITNNTTAGENILFIDQAFEVQGLFGWDKENKKMFLKQLGKFAEAQNRTLWFKPHPYSSNTVYGDLKKLSHVRLIEGEANFIESINDSKIIIGFYSTLLMPLMAMKHTVCFSLEMHPAANSNLSGFLVNTGAIESIASWEELYEAFKKLDLIFHKQQSSKQPFIAEWLYKFDGKATDRLRAILLSNEAA